MLRIKKDKFIICNYTPNKINDLDLFHYVNECIKQGKISNNNTEYCYVTTFGYGTENRIVVSMQKTKYGYRIAVYNENEIKKIKNDLVEKVSEGDNE